MDELYYEQIVERDGERSAGIARIAIIALALLCFMGGVLTGLSFLFLVALIVAGAGFYFVVPMCYVEYEYLYMARELTVDKIYNKERRKRIGSWELSSMEVMAPAGSDELRSYENGDKKSARDFTSGLNNNRVFMIVLRDKDNTRIYFEPNDDILKAIRSQFPRQVKF